MPVLLFRFHSQTARTTFLHNNIRCLHLSFQISYVRAKTNVSNATAESAIRIECAPARHGSYLPTNWKVRLTFMVPALPQLRHWSVSASFRSSTACWSPRHFICVSPKPSSLFSRSPLREERPAGTNRIVPSETWTRLEVHWHVSFMFCLRFGINNHIADLKSEWSQIANGWFHSIMHTT